MDGLCGKRRAGYRYRRGLASCRTRTKDGGQYSHRRGLQIDGRMKKEEKSTAKIRQREQEVEDADKVVVASGVTVGKFRLFRAALLRSQGT